MKKKNLLALILLSFLITNCIPTESENLISDTHSPTQTKLPVVQNIEHWNKNVIFDNLSQYNFSNQSDTYNGEEISYSSVPIGKETRWNISLKVEKLQAEVGESSSGILISSSCTNGNPSRLFFGYQNGNWQLGYDPKADGNFTFWQTIDSIQEPKGDFQIKISADSKNLELFAATTLLLSKNFSESLFLDCNSLKLDSQIGPYTSLEISSLVIEQKPENQVPITKLPARLSNIPGEVEYIIHVSPDGNDNNDGSINEPMATIAYAQQVIREINTDMTGPIKVVIHEGEYLLKDPLSFTEQDSGQNGYQIIYEAAEGETPVISGGVEVSGWTQIHDSPLWKVTLPDDTKLFRQLYINGSRAKRASFENKITGLRYANGETGNPEGIVISASTVPNIETPSNLELHWINEWRDMRLKVSSIEDNQDGTKTIWMLQPYYTQALAMGAEFENPIPSFDAAFFIENAIELVTEPGEWYYDKVTHDLYYYPFENENLLTAKSKIPQYLSLINVQGGAFGHEVHDLAIKKLTFAYTNWTRANETGTFGWQAQVLLANDQVEMTPSHLEFTSAKNITLEGNKFLHLGAAGIHLGNNTSDIKIQGNLFFDISDTAIILGSWEDAYIKTSYRIQPHDIIISDNLINNVGAEYHGAAGINAYYVEKVEISNNELSRLPYSGISLGWGWSSTTDSTTCNNNTVANNLITEIAQTARDAGGIYTLGQMPGTEIYGNVIRKMSGTYACLYPDEGSAYITYHDNVCDTVPQWLHLWINTIHDIQIKNTYSNISAQENAGINITIDSFHLVDDQSWPIEAQEIIQNAGIRQKYNYLKLWLAELKK